MNDVTLKTLLETSIWLFPIIPQLSNIICEKAQYRYIKASKNCIPESKVSYFSSLL